MYVYIYSKQHFFEGCFDSYIILDEKITLKKITVLLYLYGTIDLSELQVIVYPINTFMKVVY